MVTVYTAMLLVVVVLVLVDLLICHSSLLYFFLIQSSATHISYSALLLMLIICTRYCLRLYTCGFYCCCCCCWWCGGGGGGYVSLAFSVTPTSYFSILLFALRPSLWYSAHNASLFYPAFLGFLRRYPHDSSTARRIKHSFYDDDFILWLMLHKWYGLHMLI